MRRSLHLSSVALCLLLAGCSAKDAADAPVAAVEASVPWRRPGDRIDSILPMTELLARFRQGTTDPGRLTGGESDRETLARRFLAALAAQDTTTLRGLLVTRAEFGWLIFPDHVYAAPPYELDPDITWLQFSHETGGGLAKLLRNLGGGPLRFEGMRCPPDTLALRGPRIVAWGPCAVTWRDARGAHTGKLFGTIVERDGRAKFLSYTSDF